MRKSKVIAALFHPADPTMFDDMETVPFLLTDDLRRTSKAFIESAIINFAYSLFGHELKQKIKTLTSVQEDAIIKMIDEESGDVKEGNEDLIKIEG